MVPAGKDSKSRIRNMRRRFTQQSRNQYNIHKSTRQILQGEIAIGHNDAKVQEARKGVEQTLEGDKVAATAGRIEPAKEKCPTSNCSFDNTAASGAGHYSHYCHSILSTTPPRKDDAS